MFFEQILDLGISNVSSSLESFFNDAHNIYRLLDGECKQCVIAIKNDAEQR
jgi:hypothetical protein